MVSKFYTLFFGFILVILPLWFYHFFSVFDILKYYYIIIYLELKIVIYIEHNQRWSLNVIFVLERLIKKADK